MDTELLVASVSGAVALGSVWISSRANRRQAVLSARMERQAADQARAVQQRDLMSHHRDPLLWAAFDLQSRLYNIVDRRFLLIYYRDGTARDRSYARRSTLHVLGEYLGQVELLRRSIQFLDLGDREDNRRVVAHFTAISNVLNNDGHRDRHFLIFRSDQRAIGELMLKDGGPSCLGYVEFCRRLGSDTEFEEWFTPLSDSIAALATGDGSHRRLIDLQSSLMDLIDFLDPNADRFPDHRRSRLSP